MHISRLQILFLTTKILQSLTLLLVIISMATDQVGIRRNDQLHERSSILSKHMTTHNKLMQVYPLRLQQRNPPPSVLSISSSSSSSPSPLPLSKNSSDSNSSWERNICLSSRNLFGLFGRRGGKADDRLSMYNTSSSNNKYNNNNNNNARTRDEGDWSKKTGISLKRCTWITKSSEEHYVKFHDECWGVPVYEDNILFLLLSLSGLFIDHNWSGIIKKRDLYREAFGNFVAKMEEEYIMEIGSNKELMVSENRVRCIVGNAKCIIKVSREFGSFSGYIWSHVNHRPTVNRYKHPKGVPFRTPKAELISKDLVRRGFRLVSPVIIYSFMQVAGMVINHLVSCFRFNDCVNIAQRSWGITSIGM